MDILMSKDGLRYVIQQNKYDDNTWIDILAENNKLIIKKREDYFDFNPEDWHVIQQNVLAPFIIALLDADYRNKLLQKFD